MFETGIRQFRMAMGMVTGRRIDPANLARLIDDALATIAEFGEPGVGARELVDGPLADPETRADFAVTRASAYCRPARRHLAVLCAPIRRRRHRRRTRWISMVFAAFRSR